MAPTIKKVRRRKLPRGAYTEIARSMDVSVEAVRSVFRKRSKSARIQKALDNYIARMERKQGTAA